MISIRNQVYYSQRPYIIDPVNIKILYSAYENETVNDASLPDIETVEPHGANWSILYNHICTR